MKKRTGILSESESESWLKETTYRLASTHPKKRAGRTKFKETRHPVYRGVRQRGGGKWVCELRNGKSRLWLGTYPTPEMAARAHDVAALALRGRSACLNFADSAWRLTIPSSALDVDVRAAALVAAEAFRPSRGGKSFSFGGSGESEAVVSDAESSSGGGYDRGAHEVKYKNSRDRERVEETGGENCNYYYMDEDAIFQMPRLLADMAEGLMVAPPPIVLGEGWDDESLLCSSDVSIWNYSAW
ncbi:hypothetical protein SAY87_031933 [Trapa incisa]|uniref:AP2/ERF domain-containing protein n=1 Tax=Trapa incisa TaxID=236973 RepID=A0AAN7KQE3_9MYRT|nr:hypothetical protein SAY87_031933 [Trapa incisa]